MITNFKLYESNIKNDNRITYFIDDLKTIINDVNNNFYIKVFNINIEYNNIHNYYNIIIKDNIQYRTYYSYTIKIDAFNRIIIKNNIFSELYYITNYNKLLEKIKTRLVSKYLNHIFDIPCEDMNYVLTYIERIQSFTDSRILDLFLEILFKYGFPKIIQDKYRYLIEAKDFDII
jgi:hypothetical protein